MAAGGASLKILFISNYYPPYEIGGYEQLCRDIVERLAGRGHIVGVLTSDRGVEDSTAEGDEPVVQRLLCIQPEYSARLGPVAQFFLTRRQTEAYNRRAFRGMAEQFCPDVVFIWNLEGLPHELAVDAESWPRVAVAYWLAGRSPAEPDSFWHYWTEPPGKRAFLKGFKRVLSRAALAEMRSERKPVRPQMRHVAVVSEYMRRKGLTENTLPSHTQVIYSGVETEIFRRPVPPTDAPPPIYVLMAGRVSPDKGIHVAIEAAGKLAQTRPQRDYRLIIAGGGPKDYLEQLKRSAATHGVAELVSFLGWLPRERIPGLMHTCHILLLPTVLEEPLARVTLEAMAAGLAVIGTLTGGTGELLRDGSNGLACAAEDSQDLACQIRRLLDDPHLRYRLACQGQQTVLSRYSLDYMVERLEGFLEQAVAEQYDPSD